MMAWNSSPILPFQVGQQLDPDQLALGGLGPPLGPRAVLAQDEQLVDVAPRLLALEQRDELAVDLQVGIAADRRGEVAIVVAGQGVMPLVLGRVDRLLQAAQQAVVDGVLLGLAGRLLEDALELEPALRQVEREAQAAGELGELVELVRLGVGVHPAEEAGVMLGQVRRDRLVGRQHELLDDLVALVVDGEMRAGHLAVARPARSRSRGGSAPAPPGEPTAAEDHGQLEHLREHPGDLRGDAGMLLPGWLITSMACS